MSVEVSVAVGGAVLDKLMPLHVLVGADGLIRRAGPTIGRLRPGTTLVGQPFADHFEIRRPPDCSDVRQAPGLGRRQLQVALKGAPPAMLKGTAADVGEGDILFDLSFGIHLAEAVRSFGLTAADFAASDHAIEMLYLVEAKSAAMDESRSLNQRLENARIVAEERAATDALTGVKNRRGMEALIARKIACGAHFGLIRVDLDFFKQINDRLGHAAGDQVLVTVGQILLEETRHTDTVFRVGGDEFVLVVDRVGTHDALAALCARILARFEQPVEVGRERAPVTLSLGATLSGSHDMPDPEEMLEAADRALYRSKQEGRGRYTVALPMETETRSGPPPAAASAR